MQKKLFYIKGICLALLLLLLPLQAFSHPAFLCSASDSFYVVNKISIIGNKQTKAHIVLREIPFKAGDTLALKTFSLKLKAAKQNLQNTSLFNFVTIDTLRLQERNINLIITLTERWYTWPIPIFEFQERNFNDWWQRRDLNRTNYGFTLNRYNFRGRKEDVAVYAQLGYTVKYGVSYNIPYLTKSQTSGLGFSFSYARNREVAYTSINNKQQFFKNPNQFSREEWVAKLKYYYRRNIYNSHYAELKWVDSFIHDTLTTITKNYFSNNATHMNYFVLDYSFTHDRRDSKIYPLIGHFSELEIIKTGLGLLKEEWVNQLNFYVNLKAYRKVAHRVYASAASKSKLSLETNQPYYIQKGLGWKDFVRGYEYYVVDGQRFTLLKTGMKYEIIQPQTIQAPLPFNKFNTFHYALYLHAYADAGYVEDRLYALANPLSNSLLLGGGLGLDYVTYYDMVFRLEFSINRMKEAGFFLHVHAGI